MNCQGLRDGHALVPWATSLFGECVYSHRQGLSLLFGNVSLLFWIIAQMPQLYKNWSRGSAESLSQVFLAAWLIGDATNLLGCLLTHQQPFQIRMAAYFVTVDVIMLSQYFYLRWKTRREAARSSEAAQEDEAAPLLKKVNQSSASLAVVVGSSLLSPVVSSSPVSSRMTTVAANVTSSALTWTASSLAASNVSSLLSNSDKILPTTPGTPQHDNTYQLGLVFSWICALTYLSSRLPQILLNHSRRSVSGVSMPMFFCAVMGNTFYAASMILSDAAVYGGHEFWIGSLPFLLGSAGTLIFDGLIFSQSLVYERSL